MDREIGARVQRVRACGERGVVVSPQRALGAYAQRLHEAEARAQRVGYRLTGQLERRVAMLVRRLAAQQPEQRLRREHARVREVEARLHTAMRTRLRELHTRIAARVRELQAIGPTRVLARGYSVTTLADGTIVRDASQARAGTTLHTRVATGDISSIVSGGLTQAWQPKRQPRTMSTREEREGGPGLFGEVRGKSEGESEERGANSE
jgi:exodeoxyribonuclease VII large subunit